MLGLIKFQKKSEDKNFILFLFETQPSFVLSNGKVLWLTLDTYTQWPNKKIAPLLIAPLIDFQKKKTLGQF